MRTRMRSQQRTLSQVVTITLGSRDMILRYVEGIEVLIRIHYRVQILKTLAIV